MVKKRRPVVLKRFGYQKGGSNKKVDFLLVALPPGRRKSKNNNIYTETRRNRSDLRGRI